MSDQQFEVDWPHLLSLVAPPTGLVCVGFCGEPAMASLMEIAFGTVVLIEAQPDLVKHARALVAGRPDWQVRQAVVANHEGEAIFHLASNPFESSLTVPESLKGLWKNISTRRQLRGPVTTLGAELARADASVGAVNWLVIDCFPALPIIHGVGEHLAAIDVLAVRCILREGITVGSGAQRDEIEAWLLPAGFRLMGLVPEAHPSLGMAIYSRDWKAIAKQTQGRLEDERAQVIKDSQVQAAKLLDQLQQAKGAAETASQEAAQRVEAAERAAEEVSQEAAQRVEAAERAAEEVSQEAKLRVEALASELKDRQLQVEAGQRALESLQDELDDHLKRVEAWRAELAEQQRQTLFWTEKCEELQAERGREGILRQQVAEQQSTIAGVTERLRIAQEQIANWMKQGEADAESIRSLRAQLQQSQQIAQLATRLNALREADLKELRERYEAAMGMQQRQHALLVELEDKLRVASQYFHQLQLPTEEPIEATSGHALTAVKKTRRPPAGKRRSS